MTFHSAQKAFTAVDQVSLEVAAGTLLGILGESGSGKSQLCRAITGLTRGTVSGRVILEGKDLTALGRNQLSQIRGRKVGYVFQDPMTSLHPFLKISTQMTEGRMHHHKVGRKEAESFALDLLNRVRIPDPSRVFASYPHELSGGMRQRVAIAMALMSEPSVLIADEPTTALDATVQLEILHLLRSLCDEAGVAIMLISHDIGVVSSVCDHVAVMYAGRVVEYGMVDTIVSRPRHPYTKKLIDCTPHIELEAGARISGISGTLPKSDTSRDACLFAERCDLAQTLCRQQRPSLASHAGGLAACHFALGDQ